MPGNFAIAHDPATQMVPDDCVPPASSNPCVCRAVRESLHQIGGGDLRIKDEILPLTRTVSRKL